MKSKREISEEVIREIISANEEEIENLGNNAEPVCYEEDLEAAMEEFEIRQMYNEGVSAVCDEGDYDHV